MKKMHVYILIMVLAIPLPVTALRFLMHTRHAFGTPTDYTADANCVGAYYMNGTGGSAETDRSGNGYTLTLGSADVGQSTSKPPGYSGNSRIFNTAETDYMYNTSLSISGADQALSIACWIRFISTNITQSFVSQYNTTGSQRAWHLRATSAGTYNMLISSNGVNNVGTAITHGIAPGEWSHVVATYDDTEILLYTNGVVASTNAYTAGIFASSADFSIGSSSGSSNPADARIDEVIVFDRALTPAEIVEIYTSGIDGTKGGTD